MKTQPTATQRYAKASSNFDVKLAASSQALHDAAHQFQPLIQATSLGAEDVVISHLIQTLGLEIPAFFLDTGALHTETTQLLERTQAREETSITVFRPSKNAVQKFSKTHGDNAIFRSIELRKACCHIRKMEPLAHALLGQRAWVTGLRQEQSNARSDVMLMDTNEVAAGGLVKCNPLAHWTWGDVWHYIALHSLDYNPLHDQFFPSIGCAPCTRAISDGEDFRSGRWWWEIESNKECGLHVKGDTN